jgi:hypothetical protein
MLSLALDSLDIVRKVQSIEFWRSFLRLSSRNLENWLSRAVVKRHSSRLRYLRFITCAWWITNCFQLLWLFAIFISLYRVTGWPNFCDYCCCFVPRTYNLFGYVVEILTTMVLKTFSHFYARVRLSYRWSCLFMLLKVCQSWSLALS